jgi:hypothetical protein
MPITAVQFCEYSDSVFGASLGFVPTLQSGIKGIGISILSTASAFNNADGAQRGRRSLQRISEDEPIMEMDEEAEMGWLWS